MLLPMVLIGLLSMASVQGVNGTELLPEFTLLASHNRDVLEKATKDVTLRCENKVTGGTEFLEVFTIRIEKQTADGSWKHVASITGGSQTISVEDQQILAAGYITQDVVGTYLAITWAVAENDTVGTYRCNVVGLDREFNAITEKTQTKAITRGVLTPAQVFEILLQDREMNDEKMKELFHDLNTLTDEISADQEKGEHLNDDLERFKDSFYIMWPRGKYALLQPNSGCPDDPAFNGKETGTYKIHAESDNNSTYQTTMSDNIHLSKPITERNDSKNFVYFRFCAANQESGSFRWPPGSYCINPYLPGDCPKGFDLGMSTLHINENDSDPSGTKQGEFLGDGHVLSFCCTDRSSPDEAINLPTKSPFYLYRMGGQCQRVNNMTEVEEHIIIDTEDKKNYDYFDGHHPDGSTDPSGLLRIELCYYS